MTKKQRMLTTSAVLLLVLVAIFMMAQASQAQGSGQNPTPIVITLTPLGQTMTPTATATGAFLPDRLEPNDELETATIMGWQSEPDLTLTHNDVDYFTGYLKAGQQLALSTTVYGALDTRLTLFWQGQIVAENDDRSLADIGSTVTFSAPADGWYSARVEKATAFNGVYDLTASLVIPTATATPLATATMAPTSTPSPSATPLIAADPAEPNNSPDSAWPITPGLSGNYTVGAGDVDYFRFIAKAGNPYICETVTEAVDTLLTVSGPSGTLATNDDRGGGRVDSYLNWTVNLEQEVVIKVEARGGSFGLYTLTCRQAAASSVSQPGNSSTSAVAESTPAGSLTGTPAGQGPSTATASLTATHSLSLTLRYLGPVPANPTPPPTAIRLLVYYDANNDRQPGPGEGIASVSVLAVDSQGQQLARVFTNSQGEAIFNLASDRVARVIVPFVPGWSARVRAGELNNDVLLGLPAVRLPIFLPVQNQSES